MADDKTTTTAPPEAPAVPRTKSQEFGDKTGEHVRQQLADLSTKLDKAIEVDVKDHGVMRGEIQTVSKEVGGVSTQLRQQSVTLDVIAKAFGLTAQVEGARAQAEAADKTRRRAVLWAWIERAGVLIIGALFALISAGHHC